MMLLTIEPGQRARAPMHENHETAIYVVSGKSVTWWGERLENFEYRGRGRDVLHSRRRPAPAGQRLGPSLASR